MKNYEIYEQLNEGTNIRLFIDFLPYSSVKLIFEIPISISPCTRSAPLAWR